MKKRVCRWGREVGMALLVVLAGSALGLADTIVFYDGVKIDGKVVEETDTRVVLEIPGGTLTYPRAEVLRVERNEAMFETIEVLGGEQYHPRGRDLGLAPIHETRAGMDLRAALSDEIQGALRDFSWFRFHYAPLFMGVVSLLIIVAGFQAKGGGLVFFGVLGILLFVAVSLLGALLVPWERNLRFLCAGMVILYFALMKKVGWARGLFVLFSAVAMLSGLVAMVAMAWMGVEPVLSRFDPYVPGVLNKTFLFLFVLYCVPFFFYLTRSSTLERFKPETPKKEAPPPLPPVPPAPAIPRF